MSTDAEIIEGDCLEVMRAMPDNSVDLIATDPPYFKVKGEAWDRQWSKPEQFLGWLDGVAEEWHRVLKPAGSLYVFASPQMGARVEVLLRRRFEVLNRICWAKPCPWSSINRGASNSGRISKALLRSYYPNSETIVFAEHFDADNRAKGEPGYGAKCDEVRGFVFEPLRAYLAGEWERAGLSSRDANLATGTQMAGHWLTSSQWSLPTRANYERLRTFASSRGAAVLTREYDDLRREYDDLRREYDDLRRPFAVSEDVPFTDVWTFPTVSPRGHRHPCEKPLEMMRHIVAASSKPGALVLDCFAGSGSTGEAAVSLGRRFVGIEMDGKWCEFARRRVRNALPYEEPPRPIPMPRVAATLFDLMAATA